MAGIGIARTPSPAIGEHVIAVGSVDNADRMPQYLRVSYKGDDLGIYGKGTVTKEALIVDTTFSFLVKSTH